MRGFHRTPALRIAAFILLSGFASGAADAACSEQDPLVSGMVGETSRVYLDGILRGLSGESPVVIDGEEFRIETRFSGSDGMELAASLLEQEFQNLGLEVRRHEYLGWFLEDVEFADSLSGWIVGDRGTILRTEDGGGHWVLQGDLDKHLYGLEVLTESRALIVAHGGTVYRTADGGRTWESTETGARRLRAISFVDSLNGWTCGDRGSAFRTRDGGVSWAPLDTRTAANLHATSFVDSMRGWMCGDNGYVLRTGDGGWNWEEFRAEDQPGFRAICFIDSQRGWVGGNGGTVLRTVDGGLSWSSVGVDTAVAIRDLEFWNPDRGWACGEEGFLFETRDGGASWDRSAPGAPADLSSLALRHGDGWMVGSYTLLRSRDLVDWEYQVSTVEGRWTNVEATLRGTVFPDVSYVICGHFDSISGIPSLRAPGADDNASGTA
ncbi:MAG: hypothetical protein KAW17_12115, partial [Candidatus Eisenbacteria sp.]|nr:hypothetical protein [Candidatus Eisenbacteria bacterium]